MNKFWKVLIVFLTVSGAVNAWIDAQRNSALEARVSALESRQAEAESQRTAIESTLTALASRQHVSELFEEQVRAREIGWFVVRTYSPADLLVSLGSPFGLRPGTVSMFFGHRPEEDLSITLSDLEGNLIDSFSLGGLVQPGDLVLAWYATEPHPELGVPWSPEWGPPAYYWNQETGLAVALLHFDGSSQSSVIVP